ncbi:MAG: hypothetical protein NTV74_04120 [Euryarchaeota archaeon]|nr:hypothetical protein [Euryarchaeota archaeon]
MKYIDNAFDEQIFSKKVAYVVAPLLGILGAYTMMIDAVSATILLAVVLGVLLKGKVDNYAFLSALLVTVSILILAGVQLLILPLIVLTLAALFDEVGNDIIDKKNYLIGGKRWQQCIGYFFDQRWVMKVVILSLAVVNIVSFYFFVSMFLFDGAYLGVRWYSNVRLQTSKKIRRDEKQGIGVSLQSFPQHSPAYVDANKIFMTPHIITQNMGLLHGGSSLDIAKEHTGVFPGNG